ncbi:hypothetical protein F5Y04DRAFT_160674 [Hypomontagnella monticulosa]|nr:hypothetical protein F5Y04DRAFT_160674 [Hypomontagnella monticulosa]
MTPTESESKMSYHTIQPLVPYREELQAAGLAVTSAEQSRRARVKPRYYGVPANHLPGDTMGPGYVRDGLGGQGDGTSEQSYTSSSGSFVEFTPIDQPIEVLPTVEHKSDKKLQSKDKGGLFPWLRKRPPATRSSQPEPQQIWPLVKDGQVQSRAKTLHPQNPQNHSYRTPRVESFRAHDDATPVTRPSRSGKRPANAITPHRTLRAESSPVQFKHDNHRQVTPRGDPEPSTRQSPMHTGLRKRDIAVARLPRPKTINEEREASPTRPRETTRQTRIQIYPHPRPMDEPREMPIIKPIVHEQPQVVSPQTTSSTVPSLPYPAQYAASRTSSLERALDEVSQQLDKMEQEADKPARLQKSPPTLADKTNRKEQDTSPGPSSRQTSGQRKPRPDKEVLYIDRKMPRVGSSETKPKRLSRSPPKSIRKPPTPPKKGLPPGPPGQGVLPTVPRAESGLKDLSVFSDYEDADINDRDVIKGLQVAIHAAADDRYDALIRDRTGLRIRRFLADLRAVGEMEQEQENEKPAVRRDGEQRTTPKGKGLRRVPDRKSVHRSRL